MSIKSSKPSKDSADEQERPSNILFVGNLAGNVTDSNLMEAFKMYGALKCIMAYSSRSHAFVFLKRIEDAKAAKEALQGVDLHGNPMKIEFARPEQWHDDHESQDGKLPRAIGPSNTPWMAPSPAGNEPIHYGASRLLSGSGKGEGKPTNVLCVSCPPSVQIDEQMLHNAMILFGEIEQIRSFPSRSYLLVEFRSVEEAKKAKEGLQGRLFNDPRISITFSSSDIAVRKDYPALNTALGGPEIHYNQFPLCPPQIDMFGYNRPVAPNSFPGPLPPGCFFGPEMRMRPTGPQGFFDHPFAGPDFNDLAALHRIPDANLQNHMGPNWRRPSPFPGMFGPPVPASRPHLRPMSGAWDVFDSRRIQREPKRSRLDVALPIAGGPSPLRNIGDRGLAMDQPRGPSPQINGAALGVNGDANGRNHLTPMDAPVSGVEHAKGQPSYIWRGVIAKGGTPVCHARCIPVREGGGSELPPIVNCSARTGLDLLAKHYGEADGFETVYFLPDSEEDFASYTEFLRYLGSKNRAGVAKLNDGTTLFLVPPSDFLTNVLKVLGPERLYGVILKLPQVPSDASLQQPSHQPLPPTQFVSQTDYGIIQKKEDQLQQTDNPVQGDTPKPFLPCISEPSTVQPTPPAQTSVGSTVASHAGVTLTPELLASLASILPPSTQSPTLGSAQPPAGSSMPRPPFSASGTPDVGIPPQGWKYDNQSVEQMGHFGQQLGNQFNLQSQLLSQPQTYPSVSFTPSGSAQTLVGSTYTQDHTSNQPQHGLVSSRPLTSYGVPSQSEQFPVSQQTNQQYVLDDPRNAQKSYGMAQGTEYQAPVFEQSNNMIPLTNQVNSANIPQPQPIFPSAVDGSCPQFANQPQQFQPVVCGTGQGSLDGEADKNHRYQSTLQFAASLLFQLQQQQQNQQHHMNTQMGPGYGNQQ